MKTFLQKLFKKDGTEWKSVPVDDGVQELDITLQEQVKKLEGEVAFLKEISRAKDEFIRVTSHEIRTPLDAMRGNIYMVLKGETGEVSPKTKEYLSDVLLGADRLLRIVNDTLDIARIETGHMKFDLKNINLTELLSAFAKEYESFVQGKNVTLSLNIEANLPLAYSDNVKVLQILANLVGNALKFTPAGGTIAVHAAVSEDTVAVSIKDSGIGIATEDMQKLFKRFPEIDSSAAGAVKGTGIGLFLSKQLADKLGGTIMAESEGKGKGSTFTFWLPVAGSERAKTLARFHKVQLEST